MSELVENPFDSIEDAIFDIASGKLIIVTDDEDRENEGDLIMAGEKVTPEGINTMIRYARGLICAPMVDHQLKRLGLDSMVQINREAMGTDFTVSVDAAEGVTTGISAYDRSETVRLLSSPDTTPDKIVKPGHVFPLRARPGGVLERAGHTEAAVDLATLAGLSPAGVICEILNDDGTCARLPQLIEFKKKHGIKMVSIAQLIEYRHKRERLVEEVLKQPFESEFGEFQLHAFRSMLDRQLHFALTMGKLNEEPTLVRVHSENLLEDLFAPKSGSHDGLVQASLKRIAQEGRGVLLYMTHPCGGLSVPDVTGAACQLEPVHMDFRGYGVGAQILSALNLKHIRLLSTSTRHMVALDGYGLEIVGKEQI